MKKEARIAFVDIETNGLLYEATKLHCICWRWEGEEKVKSAVDNFEEAIQELNTADYIVGHNFCGYDFPLLEKLGYILTPPIRDTLIMARLTDPDRPEGHSLESYAGNGIEKVQNEDWSVLTENMLHRCKEDVRLTQRLYHRLQKRLDEWENPHDALAIEQEIAYYHARQVLNGVKLDVDKARELYRKISREIEELTATLVERIGYKGKPVDKPMGKEWRPFKKDGTLSVATLKYYGDQEVWGPSCRIRFETINMNSFVQVKEYLLSIGWEPDEWTYKKDKLSGRVLYRDGEPVKSSPKITESSMEKLDSELGKQLARLFILKHRVKVIYTEKKDGNLGGLIPNLRADNRVPADGHPLGTNTRRYRHRVVVNVPKAKEDIIYGYELRDLFTHEDGMILLGTDADSLEARVAGHFTAEYDGGEFAQKLLEADIHQELADALGITRQHAKTVYYGISYGAQPKKIAETLGVPLYRGQEIFDVFWETNWALAKVRDAVVSEWKTKGHILSIDGGRLYPRSEHSVMNTKFQSTGSIIVKYATILMNRRLKEEKINGLVRQVIHYHDEYTLELLNNNTIKMKAKAIAEEAWKNAGKHFNMNVEITGEAVFGHSWAQIH